jgi:hypothetical protein
MLKAALWYARKGWPVLPLFGCVDGICECGDYGCETPAKHPRISGGVNGATTNPKLIKEWWDKWPNSNIGIRTGMKSGIFALDVDPKTGGDDSLSELEAKYGKLPHTVESSTGSGGRHIFYNYPGYYVKGIIGIRPGLDIRGDGNYIVAPPSLHISGHRYEFETSSRPDEVEIVAAPKWILDLIKNESSKKQNNSNDKNSSPEIIPDGKRDDTLTSIAGKFRRQGMEYSEILPALLAINQKRCKSPLPDSQVEKIVKSINRYEPKFHVSSSPATRRDENLNIIQLSTVESEPVEFLWEPYIPLGKLTLIDGDPGVGKSWLSLAIGTSISKGNGLPNVDKFEPGKILLLSAEDGLEDTIKPRLEVLKANCDLIFAVKQVFTLDDDGIILLDDEIRKASPKIVFIDPLVAYFGGRVDLHKANETREIMAKLATVADKNNCAIVGIRHLTKGSRNKAIYRGIGSIDLTAACRSVLLVGTEPNNPNAKAMIHIKSNLTIPGKTIGFKIDEGQFWWTGNSNLTADQILSPENDMENTPIEEAEEFLRTALSNGTVTSAKIKKDAKENDISERTLWRAKRNLNIRTKKDGYNGKWCWYLPENQLPKSANLIEGK